MPYFSQDTFSIASLHRLYTQGELTIQPKFQRRSFWSPDARSYLIDTVVRALPMPMIYLRRQTENEDVASQYEVVDGQQRLRAIFDYLADKFELKQKHNSDFPNTTYEKLPEPVRRSFLAYKLSVQSMEDASDTEVWGLFERLNRFTYTVNAQERRNAEFTGLFKQLAFKLAAKRTTLDTWKAMGVFGDQQIARMREVEMASDVLAAMLKGITDISGLTRVYREFDDVLPDQLTIESNFSKVIEFINQQLVETIRNTKFKLQVRTYSLMVALADSFGGIPNGLGPVECQPGPEICRRMIEMDVALRPVEVPRGLAGLKRALTSATSHVPERRIRNEHFVAMLTLPNGQWKQRWATLTAA